jgi:hypothetical protein
MAVYTTIDDSGLFFNDVLYTGTGTGASDRQITGVGFQPDLVWIKNRDSVQENVLADAVRGATKSLDSGNDTAEQTNDLRVGAFIADGFQLGSGAVQNRVNELGSGLVAWNWKAGTTSGISGGTITPSGYSFNTTSCFSIIAYTGTGSAATIPHGLGAVPRVIIVKKLSAVDPWFSYHEPLGNTGRLHLDTTAAAAYASSYWDSTTPTSSVFSVLNNGGNNENTSTYVAYCFADVAGFSSFGSYTGNGNADGTFVYTGFKPAYVVCKKSNGTEDWGIWGYYPAYNVLDRFLYANGDNAEYSISPGDFVSNGFKIRTSDGKFNTSGDTYIYLAFAKAPLVNSSGVPNNAR